jgi:hypothetical protein
MLGDLFGREDEEADAGDVQQPTETVAAQKKVHECVSTALLLTAITAAPEAPGATR